MSKYFYFSTPGRRGNSIYESLLKEAIKRAETHLLDGVDEPTHADGFIKHIDVGEPAVFGVDWAKDSGMNRGDVINRVDNVIYVRFKAVDFEEL